MWGQDRLWLVAAEIRNRAKDSGNPKYDAHIALHRASKRANDEIDKTKPNNMARDMVHPDGRRQRSRASRAKIIQAFMDLMKEGDPSPSAARVAKRAGVGLRSVFRHFDDMDSLYLEIDQLLHERWQPVLSAQYESDAWQDQLIELIERRAKVYEHIAPYRLITNFARFRSEQLMKNYERLMKFETGALNAILPKSVQKTKPATWPYCWELDSTVGACSDMIAD